MVPLLHTLHHEMGELHCGAELLGQLDLILKFIYFVHTWIDILCIHI